MSEALFSPSWYRVASLKPRIRAHARILRQSFRGKVWFVLQDQAAERSHRFSPAAHHFIGLMDGERTVQEIWDAVSTHLGDEAPTQEEVIRLLAKGATNRVIAGELRISEKTAARHVSNIYTKLGLPNRAAATTWAHEHKMV